MKLLNRASTAFGAMATAWKSFNPAAENPKGEKGDRLASDEAMVRMYRDFWVDNERRTKVLQIRQMDQLDGRVKRIHGKTAGDTIRGGLVFQSREVHSAQVLKREWEGFKARLQLDNREKLKSDCRGFVMEGNLPLQLVLGDNRDVVAAIRMPSETIMPITNMGGRFKDPAAAFEQRDVMTNKVLASFPAWQLAMARLDPSNFDDMGAMGRPLLDACVASWKKLMMTDEDLVIRRRMRAPVRLSHVLENATKEELETYRKQTENEKGEITTDFYSNRKGGVTPVQGDATMGELADVVHLLDTFFAGAPGPKSLFGYTEGLNRDVLQDIKNDYFEEIDGLQANMASGYEIAFRVHLLFKGIDPATDEFRVRYATRRTESANQIADLALKYASLYLPYDMIYADMGLDPDYVRQKQEEQAKRNNPYPTASDKVDERGNPVKVSITPGNAPKGESATSISNPGGNGGKGR